LDFVKNKVLSFDEKDRKVWELITDVPELSKLWAVICAVVNVIVPGMYFIENYYPITIGERKALFKGQ